MSHIGMSSIDHEHIDSENNINNTLTASDSISLSPTRMLDSPTELEVVDNDSIEIKYPITNNSTPYIYLLYYVYIHMYMYFVRVYMCSCLRVRIYNYVCIRAHIYVDM